MEKPSSNISSTNLAAIVAIAGGFLGMAGVLLGWFTASVSTATVAGSTTVSGTEDWTGTGALAVGIVVILGGLAALDMFVKEASTRRIGALTATVGGIIVLFLAILGFTRADTSVGIVQGSAAFGLYVSGVGGAFSAAAGWIAAQRAAEEG